MRLFVLFCALFTICFAWPWPPSFHNALLLRRQDDNKNATASTSPSAKPGSTASGTAKPTATDKKDETATGSAEPTAKPTDDSKGSGSGNSTSHGNTTSSIEVDDRDPPGGIAMLTPASTSTTYYKIGQDVTLVWNYTSLQVTPSAVNVIASNTHGTWTLTANASVKETNSVVWKTDKDKSGTNPLLTDKYTLVVYDAATSPTAVAKPGHLGSFVNFQFGMYLPRPYQNLTEFVCATCSGAMSQAERQTLGFIFAMGAVTLLSFTWFSNGFLGA